MKRKMKEGSKKEEMHEMVKAPMPMLKPMMKRKGDPKGKKGY